ncbi:MAG: hypothetical protein RMK90_12595, partial [Acetobacteraceae bacterium]|nr:hypothetical protein [Acetobacteraceae bacterium]
MPTVNLTLGQAWTKIADAASSGFVAQSPAVGHIEYATTATDAAPPAGLVGLQLPAQAVVGRGLVGPGHVWARCLPPMA